MCKRILEYYLLCLVFAICFVEIVNISVIDFKVGIY